MYCALLGEMHKGVPSLDVISCNLAVSASGMNSTDSMCRHWVTRMRRKGVSLVSMWSASMRSSRLLRRAGSNMDNYLYCDAQGGLVVYVISFSAASIIHKLHV